MKSVRALVHYDTAGSDEPGFIRIDHANLQDIEHALRRASHAGGIYLQIQIVDLGTRRALYTARTRQVSSERTTL